MLSLCSCRRAPPTNARPSDTCAHMCHAEQGACAALRPTGAQARVQTLRSALRRRRGHYRAHLRSQKHHRRAQLLRRRTAAQAQAQQPPPQTVGRQGGGSIVGSTALGTAAADAAAAPGAPPAAAAAAPAETPQQAAPQRCGGRLLPGGIVLCFVCQWKGSIEQVVEHFTVGCPAFDQHQMLGHRPMSLHPLSGEHRL